MQITDVVTQINHGEIAPLYVVTGQAQYFMTQMIQALQTQLHATEGLNMLRYDLTQDALSAVLDDAQEVSFFEDHKLLIVYQPLFLTTAKAKQNDATLEDFIQYIQQPVKETTIVFMLGQYTLDARKKVTKLLKKEAVVVEAEPLEGQAIHRYLDQLCVEREIAVQDGVIDEILARTNGDFDTSICELDKLALYANGEVLTIDMVDQLVPQSLEHHVFDMVDALLIRHQKQQALTMYHDLLLQGEETIKINYILMMQFRLMLQIKILQQRHYQQHQIADALHVHPYRVKKTEQLARHYSMMQLGEMYDQFVNVDYALKTSTMDATLMFELLILQLHI